MRILGLANASSALGAGHVMRTAALLSEARRRGHDVLLAGILQNSIAGARVEALGIAHASMNLDVEMASVCRGFDPDFVVVDRYDQVNRAWSDHCITASICDTEFGHQPAQVLIDPTLGAEEDFGSDAEWYCLGSRFAQISHHGLSTESPNDAARSVLVVMGSSDPSGAGPGVISLLRRTGLPLSVTAVLPRYCWPEAERAARTSLNLRLIEPTPRLLELASSHDAVISAAGTSIAEFSAARIPTAALAVMPNQEPGYARLVAAGAVLGLGVGTRAAPDATQRLTAWLADPSLRSAHVKKSHALFDGLGSWRSVRTFELIHGVRRSRDDRGVSVRPATLADAEQLFAWRNDQVTREWSRNHDILTAEQHLTWCRSSLADQQRLLLIAEVEGQSIGTVRLDKDVDRHAWEVSITLAPEVRGRGYAPALLSAAESHLAGSRSPISLVAVVHGDNQRSLRCFAAAGYVADAPPDAHGFERLRKVRVSPTRRAIESEDGTLQHHPSHQDR